MDDSDDFAAASSDFFDCEDEEEERQVLQAFAKTRACPSYETVSDVIDELALGDLGFNGSTRRR
jgi:hypothetical protein